MSGVEHSITVEVLREGLSKFQSSDHVWVNPDGNLSIFRGGVEAKDFIAEIQVEEKAISWQYDEPIEVNKKFNLTPASSGSYALRNNPNKIEYGGGRMDA